MSSCDRLDPGLFLGEYWQRQPLLIRGALPDFHDPIEPDDLAGLAMETGVDARIVECRPEGRVVRRGPFEQQAFDAAHPWTLLVQGVDHYSDEVAGLKTVVDFLPGWRFDDIMVSFATPGAGVGPHFDRYDVFLLQGSGCREWRLGQRCDETTALAPHPELCLLANFEETERHLLRAGDMLYVPPGVAHWGTAESDSMTYSIGFRAPRLVDLVARLADAAVAEMDDATLYSDPPLAPQRPGEIVPAARNAALRQVLDALGDLANDSAWFGELVSDTGDDLPSLAVSPGQRVRLEAAARLAWADRGDYLDVYANGETLTAETRLTDALVALCEGRSLVVAEHIDLDLAAALGHRGCLRDA